MEVNSLLNEILKFIHANPEYAASSKTPQGKLIATLLERQVDCPKNPDDEDLQELLLRYTKARTLPVPKPIATIPDPAVAVLMDVLYKHGDDKFINIHREAMNAENLAGKLLEFYIAAEIEPMGWAWCAGELVRSVDFIKNNGDEWEMLQIKNRSNSENSSSKRVREGTPIKHWFRIDANNGSTKWQHFPDRDISKVLSEEGFHSYIRETARSWAKKAGEPGR